MRLDKFLKESRLIKRRTVAAEIVAGNKVTINGKTGKPGTKVKTGDEIEINYGEKNIVIKVINVLPPKSKGEAVEMYQVLKG